MKTNIPARIDHDLHVHTSLSACCRDERSVPAAILDRARGQGLATIGFADHLWDESISGAMPWYVPQNVAHLLQIRTQIPADLDGIKVLVGCESEYRGHGRIGISRPTAERLDFVLIPVTHFHMPPGFIAQPSEIDSPSAIAALSVRRFLEVLDLDIASGFAHPFMPCGFKDQTDDILGRISDGALVDCFGGAAERSISIEIHPGYFPGIRGAEPEGHHDETFLRILSVARHCGCRFHFGGDAHTLEDVGNVRQLAPYVAQLQIPASQFVVPDPGRGR